MWNDRNSQSLLFGMPNCTVWKKFCQFITKQNLLFAYDPAVVFLGVYPNELKSYVHTNAYTWLLRAALFILAKMWTQPVGERINKLWYI